MIEKSIPYYPELRELIPNLGFKSSTELFSYLRRYDKIFIYFRTYTSDSSLERIKFFIKEENELMEKYTQDRGFLFVMDVPESNAIELISIDFMSKSDFMKYLKLRVFS